MKNASVVILLILLSSLALQAQTKFESEYRIKASKAPAKAVAFVQSLNPTKSIKWYKEESQNGLSIEAKTKISGRLHSVEFDTLGALQDLEIQIDLEEIVESSRRLINSQLSVFFNSHSIKKVQIQYVGDPIAIRELITSGTIGDAYQTSYELVIKGADQSGVHFYEITFDDNGELVSKLKVASRNFDHLEF
ncbi:MAG: hypothetical protein AAFX87_01465 [Bacteroidota bacterium]